MKGQKKGKKTFSDGLESILHHTLFEDNLHDKPSMFDDNPPEIIFTTTQSPTIDIVAKNTKTKKTKSFADNLEDFFKDSLNESFDSPIVTIKRNINKNSERPAIGIDVLLQKTLVEEENVPTHQQRITFSLDMERMEKLKNIARQENKPLNAVLLELVELYISNRQSTKPKTTTSVKVTKSKTKKN